jgi:hypothetical protein
MVGMKPGQFTLKRALASTALIAVGCLGLSLWIPGRFDAINDAPLRIIVATCGWSCCVWIGAGIGLLFNRTQDGAGWGVLGQIALLLSVGSVT